MVLQTTKLCSYQIYDLSGWLSGVIGQPEYINNHKLYRLFVENFLLTVPWQRHRIAPNMLKSARWFAFYFYYGIRTPVAVGGA